MQMRLQWSHRTSQLVPFATFWCHKGLHKLNVPGLCRNGIHLNHKGQYALYRSYRGAILCTLRSIALSLLSLSSSVDQVIMPPPYFRLLLLPLSSVWAHACICMELLFPHFAALSATFWVFLHSFTLLDNMTRGNLRVCVAPAVSSASGTCPQKHPVKSSKASKEDPHSKRARSAATSNVTQGPAPPVLEVFLWPVHSLSNSFHCLWLRV